MGNNNCCSNRATAEDHDTPPGWNMNMVKKMITNDSIEHFAKEYQF